MTRTCLVPAPVLPFADLALAKRLERTEASANAAFVESRARLKPHSAAEWIEVAGAYAMFDGVDSPLTQTFGLGLFERVGTAAMERLESFFAERGAAVYHEVSPLADPELLSLLGERGYRPVELTTVLYQPLPRPAPAVSSPGVTTRRTGPEEAHLWTTVAAEGWSHLPDLADFFRDLGAVTSRARGAHTFLAELESVPIAAAGLNIFDEVALMAGASTIPAGRRRGAQNALLDARLRYAAEHGCTLAMMGAAPGSDSQRNAERQGFRVAYTRIKWGR